MKKSVRFKKAGRTARFFPSALLGPFESLGASPEYIHIVKHTAITRDFQMRIYPSLFHHRNAKHINIHICLHNVCKYGMPKNSVFSLRLVAKVKIHIQ